MARRTRPKKATYDEILEILSRDSPEDPYDFRSDDDNSDNELPDDIIVPIIDNDNDNNGNSEPDDEPINENASPNVPQPGTDTNTAENGASSPSATNNAATGQALVADSEPIAGPSTQNTNGATTDDDSNSDDAGPQARRQLFNNNLTAQGGLNGACYTSKDGTKWAKSSGPATRRRRQNIIREKGPKAKIPDTYAINNPLDAFNLFFSDDILNKILEHTNNYAEHIYLNKAGEWKSLTMIELKAFLGLCLLAGSLGLSMENKRDIWSPLYGPATFRATLGFNRFKEILRFLRFDDKENRSPNDKFAPIREIWEDVSNKYVIYYIPSENIVVDEMLAPFRGRVGFKQYLFKKPAKYGIKYFLLCDAKTGYPIKVIPYLGQENGRRAVGLAHNIVLKLVEPYYNTGRNVTTDNFYTNLPLCNELLKKNMTLLGTMKENKTCVPQEFKIRALRDDGHCIFGYQRDITLLSYKAPKKNVYVLSSLHPGLGEINSITNKPEMIMDYNQTKGGVDTLDQLCQTYSCKMPTRRWPMVSFFNLLDITAVAAYKIFENIYPDWNKTSNKRKWFLRELGEALVMPQIEARYKDCKHRHLQAAMLHAAPHLQQTEEREETPRTPKRKRCHLCTWKDDKKSHLKCETCKRHVCKTHSTTVIVRKCC